VGRDIYWLCISKRLTFVPLPPAAIYINENLLCSHDYYLNIGDV